ADLRGGSEKSVSEKEVVSNQELQISENVDVTLPVEESLAAGITGDTIKTPDKLPVFVAEQSSADQDLPPSPFYEDLSEGISGKEEDLHIFSPRDTRSSKSKRKKKRYGLVFFLGLYWSFCASLIWSSHGFSYLCFVDHLWLSLLVATVAGLDL
ncbi:hypothetical protein U1Q18_040708, partial [Sarracenia purpurea var. burkii]